MYMRPLRRGSRVETRTSVLRSIPLYTAGLVSGSLRTPLCSAQAGVWVASRPPDPSVRISVRYLDGSLALAWIFERSGHVCSQEMA
jgi:hypothetical protein